MADSFSRTISVLRAYLESPEGLSDLELATALGCTRRQAANYRRVLPVVPAERYGYWILVPDSEMVDLALKINRALHYGD